MSTEFIMPKLGLTMEEGTILEWLVEDGTEITQGMAVLRLRPTKLKAMSSHQVSVVSIAWAIKVTRTHVAR